MDKIRNNMLVLIYNQLMIMHNFNVIKEGHKIGLISDESYKNHLSRMAESSLTWKPMNLEVFK